MEKQQTFCRICGSPAKGSAVLCIDNMFIETCLCDECLKKQMLRRLPQKLYASIGKTGGETMEPLKRMKTLGEYSLYEYKEECKKHAPNCSRCKFDEACMQDPDEWDLLTTPTTPPPPTTQTEEIEWHKYPDEEPPVNHENYLVKLKHTRVREVRFDGKRLGDQFASDFQPTSWAKMPKGYTED